MTDSEPGAAALRRPDAAAPAAPVVGPVLSNQVCPGLRLKFDSAPGPGDPPPVVPNRPGTSAICAPSPGTGSHGPQASESAATADRACTAAQCHRTPSLRVRPGPGAGGESEQPQQPGHVQAPAGRRELELEPTCDLNLNFLEAQ